MTASYSASVFIEPPRVGPHIVWDWNGTLLSDNDAVITAVNMVCAAFGRTPIDIDHWRSIYSRPLSACYERLLERALSDAEWASLDRLYHRAYRELLPTCRLAAGVPTTLAGWNQAGGGQSLLSMWFHDELVPLVAAYRLTNLFTRIDGLRVDVGGESKTSHLSDHLAAQDLAASDVVVIGDVVDDAVAAAKVGARCVLVSIGMGSRQALAASGMPVADSVPEALRLAAAMV
jgi:phosphoglycolate phosphatase-like HAD superfamily hydrolase